MTENLTHPFEPIFNENSQILILGSFPSEISRKYGFYYANKRNRFWQILAEIFGESVPQSDSQKRDFLLRNHIAIYDSALSCTIKGSLDTNMKNVTPADLSEIFAKSNIKAVFANGTKAYKICQKFHTQIILHHTGKSVIKLPSSSSANAKFSLENLVQEWLKILE
ncbi:MULTISPECIES: DNA-deoxyinosine glycosylase [unclassified Campylobacter]|uniref:DNA-deoxyinosine glycosylase n=1 Tax=unclassified Campylobacter TaxID=2593542 RepID=UPI003D348C26